MYGIVTGVKNIFPVIHSNNITFFRSKTTHLLPSKFWRNTPSLRKWPHSLWIAPKLQGRLSQCPCRYQCQPLRLYIPLPDHDWAAGACVQVAWPAGNNHPHSGVIYFTCHVWDPCSIFSMPPDFFGTGNGDSTGLYFKPSGMALAQPSMRSAGITWRWRSQKAPLLPRHPAQEL